MSYIRFDSVEDYITAATRWFSRAIPEMGWAEDLAKAEDYRTFQRLLRDGNIEGALELASASGYFDFYEHYFPQDRSN